MVINDCGSIPVCEGDGAKRVIGYVTDRDIVIRAVAAGRNPLEMKVSDVMSHPVASVAPDDYLDSALRILEENKIRRIPVVDHQGSLVGVLSQADIARNTSPSLSGHLVQSVSQGIQLGLL
jgi:CBS domain-containing protein